MKVQLIRSILRVNFISFCSIFILFFSNYGFAGDYYVATTGSDTNNGSFSSPWLTVSHSLTSIAAGDTLYFRGGTYPITEDLTVIDVNGSSINEIHVKNYGVEEVIIEGDYQINLYGISYWEINGITFEKTYVKIGKEYEGVNHPNHNITVKNCIFSNQHQMQLLIYDRNNSDITIDNCYFYRLESLVEGIDKSAVTIPTEANRVMIKNCSFEDISGDGFQAGHFGENIRNITIENCNFWINRNSDGTLVDTELQDTWGNCGEDGIDLKNIEGPMLIKGCTFHGYRASVQGQNASGGDGTGIVVHGHELGGDELGARNVTIEDCLFDDNAVGILIIRKSDTANPTNIVIQNNIIRNAGPNSNQYPGSGIYIVSEWKGVPLMPNDVSMYNNLIYNNKVNVRFGAETNVFENNLCFDGEVIVVPGANISADYNYWGGSDIAIPTAVRGNNDVVDAAANDIRWDKGSPLFCSSVIGAGRNLTALPGGYDKSLRIYNPTGVGTGIGLLLYDPPAETTLVDNFDNSDWEKTDTFITWVAGVSQGGVNSGVIEENDRLIITADCETTYAQADMHSISADVNFFERPSLFILKDISLDYTVSTSGINGHFIIQSSQKTAGSVENGIWLQFNRWNGGSITLYREIDSIRTSLVTVGDTGNFKPSLLDSIELTLYKHKYSLLLVDSEGNSEFRQGSHGAGITAWASSGDSYVSLGASSSVPGNQAIFSIDKLSIYKTPAEIMLVDNFDNNNWKETNIFTAWEAGVCQGGADSGIVEANNKVTITADRDATIAYAQTYMDSVKTEVNFFNQPTLFILKNISLNETKINSGSNGFFLIQSSKQTPGNVEDGVWLQFNKWNGGSITLYREINSIRTVLATIDNTGDFKPRLLNNIELALDVDSYSILVIDSEGNTELRTGLHGATAEFWGESGDSYVSLGVSSSTFENKAMLSVDKFYIAPDDM